MPKLRLPWVLRVLHPTKTDRAGERNFGASMSVTFSGRLSNAVPMGVAQVIAKPESFSNPSSLSTSTTQLDVLRQLNFESPTLSLQKLRAPELLERALA